MSDDDTTPTTSDPEVAAARPRRARTRKATTPAEPLPGPDTTGPDTGEAAGVVPAAPKRRRAAKKAPVAGAAVPEAQQASADVDPVVAGEPAAEAPRRRRATKKAVAPQPAHDAREDSPAETVDVPVGPLDETHVDVDEAVVTDGAEPLEPAADEPVAPTPRRAPVTSAEPIRMKPLTAEALLAAVERSRRRSAEAAAAAQPTEPTEPTELAEPTAQPTELAEPTEPTELSGTTVALADDAEQVTSAGPDTAPGTTAPRDPRFRRRGEPGYGEDRAARDTTPTAPTATGGDSPQPPAGRRPTLAPLFVDADDQPRGNRRRSRARGGEPTQDAGSADSRRTEPTDRPGPDELLDRLVAHAPGEQRSPQEAHGDDEPDGPVDGGASPDTGADDAGARRKRRRRGGRGRRRVAGDGVEENLDDAADESDGGPGVGVTGDDGRSVRRDENDDHSDGTTGEDHADDDHEDDDHTGDDRSGAGTRSGPASTEDDDEQVSEGGTRRRRRRRRRGGESTEGAEGTDEAVTDDAVETTVRVREPRRRRTRESHEDEVTPSRGSTRLEAKKIRRKEGRDANKRRPPILSEAEFLARRESVGRTMLVRESAGRTQIAVLEDDILVEHYIAENASNSERSMIGDVYLGRVQNVLPAMEAAFIDIGHGRNGVLYAGEVNWDGAGLDGKPKRIELALKSGQPVLVQVTKDPIGHKGARLTAQISLAGRYLVYVPNGSMSGISRKLPDTERARLKKILKELIPTDAGVIVRTAAEGATEAELTGDVERLKEQWAAISKKAKGSAPNLLQGEPDLAVKVVRDIFNSDFSRLVVTGDAVRDEVLSYVEAVAPTLVDRVETWTGDGDLFAAHRVDEQLAKALERKVFLPSGGSLVIDRTEAMTVVDVNTGRFTGSGGNLEETVTENNLEAAEELVRQLRLRDIGGIIVVDFIDMVFEANRELVIRRLVECLGRDRTKHQVAEVSSLGLVQMTRKRIGRGLLEVFGHPCETCKGRGVVVDLEGLHDHDAPSQQPVTGRVPNPGNTGRLHSANVAAGVVSPTGGGVDTPGPVDLAGPAEAAGQPEPDAATDEPEPDAATDEPEPDAATDELDGGVVPGFDDGLDGGAVDPEAELVVAGHPS